VSLSDRTLLFDNLLTLFIISLLYIVWQSTRYSGKEDTKAGICSKSNFINETEDQWE